MEKIFKDYLFGKQILVNDGKAEEYPFETLFAIANLFEIRIKEGVDLAEHGMDHHPVRSRAFLLLPECGTSPDDH